MYSLGDRPSSKPKQRQKVPSAKKNKEEKTDGVTFETPALFEEEEQEVTQ